MFRRPDGTQFEAPPVLIPQPDGKTWKLADEFHYETDAGAQVVVPKGFITDLGSIPRILWPILPPFGKYTGAVVLHDWLYHQHRSGQKHFSRCYADAVLLEAMRDLNVERWKQNVIWLGVRLGGWKRGAWRPRKGQVYL